MGGTYGLHSLMQRHTIDQMLKLAASGDKKKIVRAFRLAEGITPDKYKSAVQFVRKKVEDDHPALSIARHIATRLSPECRDSLIECLIVNTLLQGVAKRRELTKETGMMAPTTLLLSPTMRCNLSCDGCYAGEYASGQDLDRTLLQRVVDEGNRMGVYLFTLLGGEPLLYSDLVGFARANPDSYFQVFTNGTLLTDALIEDMAGVGNIAPMLSIEGTPAMTDARRGEGTHATVMRAMERLGKKGVPFGYSVTVTRENWRTLVSDDFVDSLVDKGTLIAWHFLYMPVGRDPNIDMMPAPEERDEFRKGILRLRSTKPFFPVDFWGDAPYVGGCIAGKHYAHITSEGWVEPCIFTHFATDNIHNTSLLDAFNSPFFREIRSRQPFSENLLMPCMWLDNPCCSRDIMAVSGARPTHEGADVMLTDLRDELDVYAAESARVFAPVWDSMCRGTKDSQRQ
jgi:MoaA/NifB/PqqE/SkfB family radical SAM enzyme